MQANVRFLGDYRRRRRRFGLSRKIAGVKLNEGFQEPGLFHLPIGENLAQFTIHNSQFTPTDITHRPSKV